MIRPLPPERLNTDTAATPSAAGKGYVYPPIGGNPGTSPNVTTPGSFANPMTIRPGAAGAKTFSSPDTP
ncbi:MAG: hypothetical protein AAF800_06440, partial [Planctomycetota bacterium]